MMQGATKIAVPLLFAATLMIGLPVIAAEKGLLVIKVELGTLDSQGSDVNALISLARFDVMNLATKETYSVDSRFRTNYAAAEEVDEGIYCLYSFKLSDNSLPLIYCGEPYFRVVAGRVNNAGLWRYGVSFDRGGGGGHHLIFGAQNLESILDEAKKYHREALRTYGMHVEN